MTEGITVRGIGHQILSKELFQEVTIISDMYDLNEYMALDLLCTAQIQLSYHPGLTRGLVAVLLYYDGRKALVSALRLLIQARKGVLWRLDISEGVSIYVTEYTDSLMNNGVFNRILELLKTLDVTKETELLQHNRALGDPKHHRQVLDLFEDIRQQLADIVFMWAAQSGLARAPAVSLINHMKTLKLDEDASGGIDNVALTLQMGLLYALDLSILHIREDGEEIVNNLPLLSEPGLMKTFLDELSPNKGKWECEGLHALAILALGQCLAITRLLPNNQNMQLAIEHDDETDSAIQMNVFDFMNCVLLKNKMIFKERFYYLRMHNILTDFIVLMQNKVKEMRVRAEDVSRTILAYAQEGLEAPLNLPRHYEQFLYSIATLYGNDELKMELMLEYWCPSEITLTQTPGYKTQPRSVSLFKFVRMAGDMVPPSLFVPYVTMLANLSSCSQSARYCFNLLKQNGAGYVNTISWDHFFGTFNRYMGNLRIETPPVTDTVYRHTRNFSRGITPQELQGLHAVLLLIRNVAEKDDFSRLALCEHPAWAPLSVLLALISCSVPIPLKADLLYTLAALSKSPETAAQMWHNLEASQILVTVPSTSSYQARGIQTELEEIESRNEEYPLTRSLLKLLDVLTDSGIPRTLGAGPRKPGFDPYLTFIINSVFLRFHTRAYKNPEEKWLVAKMCLKLLEKFLMNYEPQSSDFPVGNQSSEFNPPPGFHLMIQLNTKSQFLDLILFIIDEGCSYFDSFQKFPGREYVEDSTLSCLNILNRALILQTKFHALLANSSCTILLTGLSKLLLAINPRNAKPDYVIKVCKFIGYHSTIPKHALVASKVMLNLTQQPSIHSQVMTILLSHSEMEQVIRWGFVDCLDADEDWSETSEEECVLTATKEVIINLLKQCLTHSTPNLTHYLFGFDLKKDVSKTIFQFPGVCGFPRTCLHGLFSVMNSSLSKQGFEMKPSLIEASYNLLYALCENPKTVLPVLKFIKQNQDFFGRHIGAIKLSTEYSTSKMNQISWLLKTIAVEQKICSAGNQIFYLKHLTKLLVGFPNVIEVKDKESVDKMDAAQVSSNGAVNRTNFLLDLISIFNFNNETILAPQWDYFDNSIMEKLIDSCEMGQNPRLINVKKLHQVLIDELTTLQGTAAASQRQLILQEIQKVLTYAIKVNNVRQYEAATIRFMDAWRQLVQVIFVTLPADVMTLEEQQILIVELLETLLNKMLGSQPLPEVATLASGAVLLLMNALNKSHLYSIKRKKVIGPDDADRLFVQNILYTNPSSLKFILHSILQWVIISGVSSQRLRVNLYGALLSYLHMISVGVDDKKIQNQSNFYVSRLDNPEHGEDRILVSADVLSSFGDKLIEVMCHDCIGGHDICKMLAMSSFNRFLMLNVQISWINFLSTKGFLKHLIDSILNSDNELKAILETVPETLRCIYLYETKMALMVRLGSTRYGAEVLLEQRLLACLASMRVFDDHPRVELQVQTVSEDCIPSVESRYHQILFPALDLCDAILSSLGVDNRAAVAQVMFFLLSHLEVVENVLQQGRTSMPVSFLKELGKITGNYPNIFRMFIQKTSRSRRVALSL